MNKIRELRKIANLSQIELAEHVNVHQTAISQWETGKTFPDMSTAQLLADTFGVSIDSLLGRESADNQANAVRIIVYGSIPAGIKLEAIEDIIGWEEIPKELTKGGKEYIGLKVKGNSMYPKYLDGDTVIVRLQPDCESGQDCVVYVNGFDATLKKVVKKKDGLMLQPINPEYDPEFYDYNSEHEHVTILGTVIELRRKI